MAEKETYGIKDYIKLIDLGLSEQQINTFITVMDANYNNINSSLTNINRELSFYKRWLTICRKKQLDEVAIYQLEDRTHAKYYIKKSANNNLDSLIKELDTIDEQSNNFFDVLRSDLLSIFSQTEKSIYEEEQLDLETKEETIYISQGDQKDIEVEREKLSIFRRQLLVAALIDAIINNLSNKKSIILEALGDVSNLSERFKDWTFLLNDMADLQLEPRIHKFRTGTTLVSKEDANRRIRAALYSDSDNKNYILDKYTYK